MPTFLVEGYLAAPDRAELTSLALRAQALEAVRAIRHLGSFALVEDEICFHIIEAPSAVALVEASELVGLEHERVVETIWIAGTPASEGCGVGLERT